MGLNVTLPVVGKTSNLITASFSEEITPIDISSSNGGVGQMSMSLLDPGGAPRMKGGEVLVEGNKGKTSGVITGVSGSDGVVTVTADSTLGLFNTDRIADPFSGTFGDLVQYYVDLVGITSPVQVDPTVASRAVVYPGWSGNVWLKMKQLMAAQQVELSLVFDTIYVRPLRSLVGHMETLRTRSWSVDSYDAAQTVEITWNEYTSGAQIEVYPVEGEDPNIITVDSGEVWSGQLRLQSTLTSVNQPVVVDWVEADPLYYEGTDGVYAVSGNDGLPVTASQWVGQGGSVTVDINEKDHSVLDITVVGAVNTDLAPFRIAMTAGTGNYYNALHITGDGVRSVPHVLTIPTGAANTSVEVGVTTDNPFVTSLDEAYCRGMQVAQAYSGTSYSISGTLTSINQAGEGNQTVGFTFDDFASAYVGLAFNEFNALWAGKTFNEFNEYWASQMETMWPNQAYGNAAGSRVYTDYAVFRVTQATITQDSVSFTAYLDTTFDDFNTAHEGLTFDDFAVLYDGYTFDQFNLEPLKNV